MGDVAERPRGEIVEDRHAVPPLNEGIREVRANEARASGYQMVHWVVPASPVVPPNDQARVSLTDEPTALQASTILQMSAHRPNIHLLSEAFAMQAEATARAVIPEMRRHGIDPIVLKGPALAAWLYRDGARRTYADLDLLVDPATFETAGACLERLGYERGQAGWDELSFAWRRPDQRFAIDLHRSLVGADSAPGIVWRELRAHAREGELLGVGCLSLDEAGLALHVATHAAQHAFEGEEKPAEDLRRALATADRETWEAAAALAARIGASPAFAAGLRTLPDGAVLADGPRTRAGDARGRRGPRLPGCRAARPRDRADAAARGSGAATAVRALEGLPVRRSDARDVGPRPPGEARAHRGLRRPPRRRGRRAPAGTRPPSLTCRSGGRREARGRRTSTIAS